MKAIKYFIVYLALAMTACTHSDELFIEDYSTIETISAEIIQPMGVSSRVIVGEKDETETYPMTWRADDPNTAANEADAIYVYDSEGNAARFIYNEDANAPKGIFIRDKEHGTAIKDIKEALCVPSSVGLSKQLPVSANSSFNYMSTMMYHRGAENAPMYGKMENGVLKFNVVTGLLEINITNLNDYRPTENDKLGVKVTAYSEYTNEETNVSKDISSTEAHIDLTDPEHPVLCLDNGTKQPYIGINFQSGVALDTKMYCPLILGEYARLEITIYPDMQFTKKKPLSETVVLTPKGGKKTFTIENKVYSVKKAFVKLNK